MEDIRDECECGCECERKEPVCMNACIMRVWCCQLLVCDRRKCLFIRRKRAASAWASACALRMTA